MSTVDSSEVIWAKIRTHPWLPGRICTEEVPGNIIARVSLEESAKCVFFFGIHEYAWIDINKMFNYHLYRENYQKQRLHQYRRNCLEIAMNEADRYINDPSFKSALLGYIQKTANNASEAIRLFNVALKTGDFDPVTFFEYFHCTRIVCDWSKYDENIHILDSLVEKQLKEFGDLCIDTHTALFYPFSPVIHKAIAQYWAEHDERDVNYWQRNYKFTVTNCARIKVGYVSSDFRDHATSHLFQSIPDLHERGMFEVYCFALNDDDGSTYYRKIANESEHFIDLSRKNDAQAADRIHSLGIDILVNMNGHTEGGRNEIFALRPAPIQAVWLGFPCTMGAKYMDYFIGDATATPIECCSHFTEKLAQLPHSYFVGDHKQMFPHLIEKIYLVKNAQNFVSYNSIILNGIGLTDKFHRSQIINIVCGASKNPIRAIESPTLFEKIFKLQEPLINVDDVQVLNGTLHPSDVLAQNIVFTTRAQYGLKAESIVFCNFNQLFKLDPSTFESWLKIIGAVPNSTLWLLRYPNEVEKNLRTAAINFGFKEMDRIIFSDITSKEEHVRRCQLADICLDTVICNGHSTTLDVLWSGTPVLTVVGITLASRASASILYAMGLSELVSKNVNDFVQNAIRLGNDPIKLRNYRMKINEMLTNCPVFDCEHFTSDLESLYIRMWKVHALGKPAKMLTNPTCAWN